MSDPGTRATVGARTIRATGVVLVAVIAVLAAGCTDAGPGGVAESSATPGATGGSGAIRVGMTPAEAEALADVVSACAEESGIEIEIVPGTDDEIRSRLQGEGAADEGLDIAVTSSSAIGDLATAELIAPLETSDQGAFASVGSTAMSHAGRAYGVPLTLSAVVLVRNTDLAPQAPRSFAELIAIGDDAVAGVAADYPLLIGIDGGDGAARVLHPLQASFSAPAFPTAPDGSLDRSRPLLGGEQGESFAIALRDWSARGLVIANVTGDIARDEFLAGKAPFLITTTETADEVVDSGLSIAVEPVPAAGGTTPVSLVDVRGMVIPASSDRVEDAGAVMESCFGTLEAQTALVASTGRTPAALDAIEQSSMTPATAALAAIAVDGVALPTAAGIDEAVDAWGGALLEIIDGGTDPVARWRALVGEVEGALTP